MRSLLRPALFALWTTALVAIAANLIVLLAGQAANGAAIVVSMQGMTLTVDAVAVVGASVVGAVLAAVGAAILSGLMPRVGLRVFAIAGVALTLLSLFATSGAGTATGTAALAVMHVVTGTVMIVGNTVIHSRAKQRAASSTR